MENSTLSSLFEPDATLTDSLTELLRKGARELIAHAVESELELLLKKQAQNRLPDGRLAVVRKGYLPERTIQTGIGEAEIKIPKVRDRSGSGIKFNSSLLPPYLKRAKNINELLPWLYLKGISTGDFQEALVSLLGKEARGLSARTISRLKADWIHIRTTNPIESTFSTVRLRTAKTRSCGSREATLAMVFKLIQSAEKRWKRIKGFDLIGEVIEGVLFKDGVRTMDQPDRNAA
jgi:transposase-like protein